MARALAVIPAALAALWLTVPDTKFGMCYGEPVRVRCYGISPERCQARREGWESDVPKWTRSKL